MSLFINGRNFVRVYYNGKYYNTGYYKNKLVLVTPDYNDYLMYKKLGYLKSSDDFFVSYKNKPQIVSDLISGSIVGKKAFEVSLELNTDSLSYGTVFLLNIPGLFELKWEKNNLLFLFPWEENPVWKSLPENILTKKWNNVCLKSDGKIITITVNDYSVVLLDTTKSIDIESCVLDGFSASNYLQLKEPFPSSGTYQMIFNVTAQSVTSTQPVIARNNADRTLYLQGSSSCFSFYDGSSVVGKTKATAGSKYWVGLEWTGSSSNVYLAKDDNTKSLDMLPGFSDSFWNTEVSGRNSEIFLGNAFRLGQNGGTSTFWRGSIDIYKTKITINDLVFLNGKNWKDVFNIVGTLNETYEHNYIGVQYPLIENGDVAINTDWNTIKNIKATVQGE